jgi:hypothetical protein
MKGNKVLRVGFDLDGVILYNPARIFRPMIALIKSLFFDHKKPLHFYYPKSKAEKFFWRFFHLSSIFPSPGLNEIKRLIRERKIKAYLVTARYSFLKKDLDFWIKKLKLKKYFSGIYYNQKDEQPHLFKEKMIKKLKLDIFVEDNWDIVDYLNKKLNKQTKIFWIYNLLDKKIRYKNKFSNLKEAIKKI